MKHCEVIRDLIPLYVDGCCSENTRTLVEEHLGKPSIGNILYHLDMEQLRHYTHGEVDKILAR